MNGDAKLDYYKDLFCRLNVNRSGGRVAPHKAILLLTVMDMIEREEIDTPFIPITRALENNYKRNWERYVVEESPFRCVLNYPFYHLASSPFWKLVKSPVFEERKEYSMAAVRRNFVGALLEDDLFRLMLTEEGRKELREVLVGMIKD